MLVAASTRSWPGLALCPATVPGSRASRKVPLPSSSAVPACASHGLAPTVAVAGCAAARMPRPPNEVSPAALGVGTDSPVPTRTKSAASFAPNETRRQPHDWALFAPPERAARSAQPPTGSHELPPFPEYHTPPIALAA